MKTHLHRTFLKALSMTARITQLLRSAGLFSVLLASQALVFAEPVQTLAEKRLSIIKGTSPGIVLFDFDNAPRAAAPVATSTSGTTGSTSPAVSAPAAAPQPTAASRFFSALPPPSGRSLQSARRLDAPDQGVALPTASTMPPKEPAAKP